MTDVTCRTIIEQLDDLLEGRLSPADRHAAEGHLRSCASCRELESLVAAASAPVAPPADLLGAVLLRTSGSACGSARARLCDHADDDLVRMHLDGCGECGGLAAALARLPGRWTARLAAAWRRLAQRPRIAWEGAYAGSIIVLILFGTPNAPFADVPGRALDLVRTVQESLPADAARKEAPRIRMAVRSRWTETKAGIEDATRDLTAGLKRRSSATWDGLKKNLGTVWDRIASEKATNANDGDGRER